MQESSLTVNIQQSVGDFHSSSRLINYSSSAKMLEPSSSKLLSPSNVNVSSPLSKVPTCELLQKCVRRGDKVYKVNPENINMLEKKRAVKDSNGDKKSSVDSSPVDKVESGESLYKEFSFTQSSNNDDTQKCIAFWKSVMEKNLAPIKCSIIEETQRSSESLETEESVTDSQRSIQTEVANLHEDYKNLIQSVLRDLQRKRLHEIKMYGARCRLCESLSSSVGVHSEGNLNDFEAAVAELDDWSPKSKKKEKIRPSAAPLKKTDVKDEPKSDEMISEKPVTNIYKHVDVIEEKTKTGAYTAWRRNKVEEPCLCGNLNCDCNTNPAISSIGIKTSLPGKKINVKSEDKTVKNIVEEQTDSGSEQETSYSSEEEISEESLNSTPRNDEGINYLGKTIHNLNQSVSFITHCNCGIPNCKCQSKKVTVSQSKVIETETHQVIQPTITSDVTVTSSFEITHKTIEDTPRTVTANNEENTDELNKTDLGEAKQECVECEIKLETNDLMTSE